MNKLSNDSSSQHVAVSSSFQSNTMTSSASPPQPSPSQASAKVANKNTTTTEKNNSEAPTKIRKPRFKKTEHKYPVEPRVIQVIKKPKTYMDHSYRDFSQVPPEMGYVHPTNIADMTFAQKVHHMLSDDTISNWVHWLPHGRAFKIAVPKRLEQSKTLQRYFGHNRYSSFLRQLNNHGFKHLTRGTDRNCYYHECMLRGMPHLAKYMPPGRDARRLMPDPDNEPDFYAIDRLFPLGNGSNSNKAVGALGNPLLGSLGTSQQQQQQNQFNPFLGGLGNFQQLPPGLLAIATPPAPLNNNPAQGGGMNQGPNMLGVGNFHQAQVNNNNSVMMNNNNATTQHQGPNLNDPKLLAALFQQQQQMPPQHSQRAQSSLMRFM